ERVLAQDPIAERVEGRDLDVGIAVLHEGVDALFHLGGGLVGEGQREDLFGAGFLLGDEPRDAAGGERGCARARARADEGGGRGGGRGGGGGRRGGGRPGVGRRSGRGGCARPPCRFDYTASRRCAATV